MCKPESPIVQGLAVPAVKVVDGALIDDVLAIIANIKISILQLSLRVRLDCIALCLLVSYELEAQRAWTLQKKIAKLRKLRDWTQDDLAKKMEVHKSHVSRWELGHKI